MTMTAFNRIVVIAVVAYLSACGADERNRRRAVSFSHDGSSRSSSDAVVSRNDPAARAALEHCRSPSSYVCEVEAAIISYTNAARTSQGIAAVTFGPKLGFAAREWSVAQAEQGKISHDGFPTAREAAMVAEYGEDHGAKVLGENVATNMMQQNAEETGKVLANQWWNSPSHKSNVLGAYPALGVGVSVRGNRVYATQLFGRDPSLD